MWFVVFIALLAFGIWLVASALVGRGTRLLRVFLVALAALGSWAVVLGVCFGLVHLIGALAV